MRRLGIGLSLLVGVVCAGTLGYMVIEHWNLADALYMTVITVGTVGFREVHPLSRAGEVFTMVLILAGVMDASPDAADAAHEEGWAFIQGDATEESVLLDAGIKRAGAIVTALSGDADNLFVTVSARALNPGIFIVARSAHETTEAKLLNAGANRTITPNVIGGRRMASMVLHPTVSDYLDIVTSGEGVEFRLQEIELTTASCFVGQSLSQARIRERTGAQVVAILHADGHVNANPAADTLLVAGERLVVLGTPDQVAVLTDEACPL